MNEDQLSENQKVLDTILSPYRLTDVQKKDIITNLGPLMRDPEHYSFVMRMAGFLGRCFSPKPETRYESSAEMKSDLEFKMRDYDRATNQAYARSDLDDLTQPTVGGSPGSFSNGVR